MTQKIKELVRKSVEGFRNRKILVIGDVMIDEYIWGTVSRISPEAPVPVVVVEKDSKIPGGATNVVNNLADLGTSVFVCGVIGQDNSGKFIKNYLKKKKVNVEGLIEEAGRPTSRKTRIVAHQQQVVRVDREKARPIKPETIKKIISFVKEKIRQMDAVILSDYGKGVVVPPVIENVIKTARQYSKIITVDPKIEHFFLYKGVNLITPNHNEVSQALGKKILSQDDIYVAGKAIMKKLQLKSLLITQSKDGMTVFQKGKAPRHIPTHALEVYDVTGAGDTVISTATAALASGLDIEESAVLSNFAAGIVVGEVGTTTISAKKLIQAVKDE
ncbi:MAG: D-glycero-beta-D-manno-heptose-7-phosphate kinase [Spirochaetes bacterium]|nr:D-glycero-beta-D-manno-heptose-7-phosphate kinase [Spirochaetota bacterium]